MRSVKYAWGVCLVLVACSEADAPNVLEPELAPVMPIETCIEAPNAFSIPIHASDAIEPNATAADPLRCPGDLVCDLLESLYACQDPGSKPILCESVGDCPAEISACLSLGGQGVCVRPCAVEAERLFTTLSGELRSSEDAPLEGVEVCVEAPPTASCALTDAEGRFRFVDLPANRKGGTITAGVLTFAKEGYVLQRQELMVGLGERVLPAPVRMLSAEPDRAEVEQ